MMYNEFIENTGCKDNAHNYKVYKDLEVMYMNSDISKEQIYEYGKKLVDNSKTSQQIALEEKIKDEIEVLKTEMAFYKSETERCLEYYKEDGDEYWKDQAKHYKDCKRTAHSKISELKWILRD